MVATLFEKYALMQDTLSTAIDMDDELIVYLKSKLQRFVLLDEYVALPTEVEYGTLKTLDKDRLAAVVEANYLRPGKNLLVINTGTTITYEMIEASGIFLGGSISPGMIARFQTLNHPTKKLSLVTEEGNISLIGRSAGTVIQTDVVSGIVYEMDGYTDELKVKYPDPLVFLTGGHPFYFERRLKNSISADINLVLTGLSRILEYSVEDQ